MIWQVGEAGTNQAKERISGEMLASLRGNDRHGNPRLENLKSFQGEGYCRIDVYEKATGISRWLLGFVALRELLNSLQDLAHRSEEIFTDDFRLLQWSRPDNGSRAEQDTEQDTGNGLHGMFLSGAVCRYEAPPAPSHFSPPAGVRIIPCPFSSAAIRNKVSEGAFGDWEGVSPCYTGRLSQG